MGSKANLLKNYPNLDNPKLPYIIGCVMENEKKEAKQGFRRVCFKDVKINGVEPIRNNRKPSCIWMIYYQLKHQDIEMDDDDSNSSILPPSLPEDEQLLSKLYEDITGMSLLLGMYVVRKYHTQDRLHVVVEYSPKNCNCSFQDFSGTTQDPSM